MEASEKIRFCAGPGQHLAYPAGLAGICAAEDLRGPCSPGECSCSRPADWTKRKKNRIHAWARQCITAHWASRRPSSCQGTVEQILAERVAVKIGMIIRGATLVVAGLRRRGAQRHERTILPQPKWDGVLRAVCLVRLLAKGINHSRRRLSRIPSRKTAVAPAQICSAVP